MKCKCTKKHGHKINHVGLIYYCTGDGFMTTGFVDGTDRPIAAIPCTMRIVKENDPLLARKLKNTEYMHD